MCIRFLINVFKGIFEVQLGLIILLINMNKMA